MSLTNCCRGLLLFGMFCVGLHLVSIESLSQAAPARKLDAPNGTSGSGGVSIKYINPDSLFESDTYSKAVAVEGARKTVYFSGSIPLDKAYNVQHKGDIRAQTRDALKNLEASMTAAGVGKNNVVKLTVNILFKDPKDTFAVAEELQAYFDRPEMPATTIVPVPFLIAEGVQVQIEAIAVI